jgi:7-cyano-7-deazaguanine tRNA-ribosyltransferase
VGFADLVSVPCLPAVHSRGVKGQRYSRLCNRVTHNLWTLLEEARQIEEHLADGTYEAWYGQHVENSVYRPLIDYVLERRQG